MSRKSGVLMPVSSLYGEYSIGTFGKAAQEFVDFLKACKFGYWQVLPFNIPDNYNSPYQSISAFAGNHYYIDPLKLYEDGLVTKTELKTQLQNSPYSVEYKKLRQYRLDFLILAFKRLANYTAIESFLNSNLHLKQFCKFMALKKANNNQAWRTFDESKYDINEYFFWGFLQKRFLDDWIELKRYANQNGIKIIGDMPIYVSYESADVWGNSNLFWLDETQLPKYIAGVPPDYFCEDGQLWGNPLYDWDEMKKTDFLWWIDRIKWMTLLFDGIRIDHFRGFSSFYAIPYGAPNAKNGKWIKGPGKALINAINRNLSNTLIIAEDLGNISDDVKELITYSGYKGMRVMQFGFLEENDNLHLPHNYDSNIVAYTGTHDNNTLLAYLYELDETKKAKLFSYCNFDGINPDEALDSVIKTLFASHADTIILPIQDLLGFGKDTRMNTPGTTDGNWSFRITKDQLEKIDTNKLAQWNSIYKRG